jgi:class 3 adenylate cyclase
MTLLVSAFIKGPTCDPSVCTDPPPTAQPPFNLSTTVSSTKSQVIVAADGTASEGIEGERKTVTALFAKIKGSTELMEDLDPEEARTIVDPAPRPMTDAVHRYDRHLVQSTGDGILALFGAAVALAYRSAARPR